MPELFALMPDPNALKEILLGSDGLDLELSYASKLYLEENPSFQKDGNDGEEDSNGNQEIEDNL